jgi:hypothetical protein
MVLRHLAGGKVFRPVDVFTLICVHFAFPISCR